MKCSLCEENATYKCKYCGDVFCDLCTEHHIKIMMSVPVPADMEKLNTGENNAQVNRQA